MTNALTPDVRVVNIDARLDLPFLWEMLAASAHATVEAVCDDPKLRRYLHDWPRDGDFGLVAGDHINVRMGAVWIRRFKPEEAPYFHLPEAPHEIVIGVACGYRRRGVGRILLERLLFETEQASIANLSLNVRSGNPAVALYGSLGFQVVREITNRIGTKSLIMMRSSPKVPA